MGTVAVIPAAPVLLEGIDHRETEHIGRLRQRIQAVLAARPDWALPVEDLPPVLGLGGWGIDRGIDTRTGALLVAAALPPDPRPGTL